MNFNETEYCCDFLSQVIDTINKLQSDKDNRILLSLVADTKNTENTGETFESHYLSKLIKEFDLTELKGLSESQKKRIDKRATKSSTVYKGMCKDGKDVYLLHFPKSSPDFLIVHPFKTISFELKSSIGTATEPTFNAGLNDGNKVRSIFYLYYKQSTNELILRAGDQFFPQSASDALDDINTEVEKLLSELTKKYSNELGIYSPWYPRRTKYKSNSGLWEYCPKLHSEALDLLSKV